MPKESRILSDEYLHALAGQQVLVPPHRPLHVRRHDIPRTIAGSVRTDLCRAENANDYLMTLNPPCEG